MDEGRSRWEDESELLIIDTALEFATMFIMLTEKLGRESMFEIRLDRRQRKRIGNSNQAAKIQFFPHRTPYFR